MSKMIVDKVKLKAIANAVRFKDGSTNTMHLPEIPDRIKAIPQSMGDGLVSMAFSGTSPVPFNHLGTNEMPSGKMEMSFTRIHVPPVVHVAADIELPYALCDISV
jgi:hypothetical protein